MTTADKIAVTLLLLLLCLPGSVFATDGDSKEIPADTDSSQVSTDEISAADRELIENLELIELLDLLEDMNSIASMEDAQ